MWQEILRIAIYYRRWLTVALVLIVIYNLALMIRPGSEVLMANAHIAAGQKIHDVVAIRADELPEGYEPVDLATLAQFVAKENIAPGTILTSSLLTNSLDSESVIASLAIDNIDSESIPVGSRVHVWALGDDGARLVSLNAQLLKVIQTSMSTMATLQIPREDEFNVLQAAAIRVVRIT